MPSGKPAVRCHAKAKTTGERCGNAPIPGGTICRFHGANRAVRDKANQRVLQRQIMAGMRRWERYRDLAQAAREPWADEPSLAAPITVYTNPGDLRRIAREMQDSARILRQEATRVERERAQTRSQGSMP